VRPLPPRRRYRSAFIALALVFGVACRPGEQSATTTSCASTIEEASRESEPAAQVRMLDLALIACASYDSFTSELARYPSSIGYDAATYVERRCTNVADEAVLNGATCAAVITPATTAPPTTLVDLVFVGDTVDGRPIEIRPGGDIEFIGDTPAVIQQTVDIAFESGCDGVLAQRDRWAARIDDSPEGDIASVYAQHAQNVANFIRCDSEQLTPEQVTPETVG
jgi:hypothetical protein